MKNIKSYVLLLISAAILGFTGTSCSDMLEPSMDNYSDLFAKDSVYSAFGILMSVQDVAHRNIILDDTRSDLVVTGTYTTDSVASLVNFENPMDGSSALLDAADYYHIINSCNFYMANCDTLAVKNNYPELKREYAQVETIRAWAYLQLVRIYGQVPFITEPISSTGAANRLLAKAPKVDASSLATELIKSGMLNAFYIQMNLGMPDYEDINNGSAKYPTKQMFIPAQLVLGDAYLMQNNYEKAAEMYYNYFSYKQPETNNTTYSSSVNAERNASNQITGYHVSASNWIKAFTNHAAAEKYAICVSAASANHGKMFNDLQHIYGFTSHSTQAQETGSTTVTATEEAQQLFPSPQYISLNQAQVFNKYEYENDVETKTPLDYETNGCGDARLYNTAPMVEFLNGNRARIIDKYCPASGSISSAGTSYVRPNSFSMAYDVALYRNPQVWLRYAEAINRMGFPQTAFAVLKDGLYRQTLPTCDIKNNYTWVEWLDVFTREVIDSCINIVKYDTIYYSAGEYVDVDTMVVKDSTFMYAKSPSGYFVNYSKYAWEANYEDSTMVLVKGEARPDSMEIEQYLAENTDVPYSRAPQALNGGAYYVSFEEAYSAQQYPNCLDFKNNSVFSKTELTTSDKANYGIHGRGCGDVGGNHDTVYTYAKVVGKKIAENRGRVNGWSYSKVLDMAKQYALGDSLNTIANDIAKEEIINAVEDVLIDEGALETAFEGTRFFDLMRVADHKTVAGADGAEWLAWKVARRDYKVTDNLQEYDKTLYGKLLQKENWFLDLPKEVQ